MIQSALNAGTQSFEREKVLILLSVKARFLLVFEFVNGSSISLVVNPILICLKLSETIICEHNFAIKDVNLIHFKISYYTAHFPSFASVLTFCYLLLTQQDKQNRATIAPISAPITTTSSETKNSNDTES